MPEVPHKDLVSLWGPSLDDGSYVLEHSVTQERLLLPPGGTWVLNFTEQGYGYVACIDDEDIVLCNKFCCDLFQVSLHEAGGNKDWWLQGLAMGSLLLEDAKTKHEACHPQISLPCDGPCQAVAWKAYRLLLPCHGARVFMEDRIFIKYLLDAQPPSGRKPCKLLDNERSKWKRHMKVIGLDGHMLRGTEAQGPGRQPGPMERQCLPWSSSSCYVFVYVLSLYAAAELTSKGLAMAGQAARLLMVACIQKCISTGFSVAVLVHPDARGEPGLGVSAASVPSAPKVELDLDESGLVDLSGLGSGTLGPCAAKVVALLKRCGYPGLRLPLDQLLALLLRGGDNFTWLASQLHNWLGMLLEATILAEGSQQDASVASAPAVAIGQREDHELLEASSLAGKQLMGMVKSGKCRFVRQSQKCLRKVLLKYTMACRQVCAHVGSVGIAVDASRLAGKDTLLGVILHMGCKKAFYMLPQAIRIKHVAYQCVKDYTWVCLAM